MGRITMRRAAGVALVSVLGPVLAAVISGVIGQVVEPTLSVDDLDPDGFPEMFSIILLIGIYGGLLTIVPASLLAIALASFGARTRRVHAIAGAALGLVLLAGAIAVLRSSGSAPLSLLSGDVLVPVVAAVLAGAVCGTVYWRIAARLAPPAG
jgi:hypothetical protein